MKGKVLFSFISGTLILTGQAFAQQYTFLSMDVQCPATAAASECPAGLTPGQVAAQTSARGINARGEVVGFYVAGGKQHGFLLKDRQYTSLDFPVPDVRGTIANGTNARGEIVGQYVLPVQVKDASGRDLPEDSPLYCPPNLPSPPNPAKHRRPACIKGFITGTASSQR
jgi:probable HAF family extracellular repeat protein